jgi:hypothetical protein
MAIRSFRVSVLLLFALLLVLPQGGPRAASLKREMGFAVDLAEKGLWNEAAHRFLSLLKREPYNPRLWNNLGVAYEALGEYDKAHEAYDKAVTLMAHPPDSLLANQEAFESFYRVWQDPVVTEQPPLMDPRTAGTRPVKPAVPTFPGPDFDDDDQPGQQNMPTPIFPDPEPTAADQPETDDPEQDQDDEPLASPYPTGDDAPMTDPASDDPAAKDPPPGDSPDEDLPTDDPPSDKPEDTPEPPA